jgi:hypothetical protein
MPTKIIREPKHIQALAKMLSGRKLPITVTWTQGASRSSLQNRLSHRWYADVSRQLGDQTTEEVRAYCKLMFGVPLLQSENEAFQLAYDNVMEGRGYGERLAIIQALDLPVTRLMTVKQMTAFMDEMQRHWSGQGVQLTDPEAMRYEEEFGPMVAA